MREQRHEAAIAHVLKQLTAIAVIRRQLGRRLPQGSRNAVVVLAALTRTGEVRPSELAEHLDCDLSVVSRKVAHLEQRGLVSRRANPEDRRSSLIGVTAEGRAEVDRLVDIHTDLIAEATEDWTARELADLTTLLDRLRGGLARRLHGAEVPDREPDPAQPASA
ncbi:MarR family winged helix-turn-helix transcriptional regulator [Streptomyces nigra]|uniref:MarR family winged helix-turn-helix transcriptional regulator n=1 Tax=Streptomyces nigra TaxID=1827580 RepID=UPI0035D60E9A